jgi:putative glutamine amidotransferase
MKDRQPVIGVVPLWDEYRNSIWMIPGYMDGIIKAGGLPVILPFTDDENVFNQAAALCDGFLLTGGQDVAPELYGEAKRYDNIITCKTRDRFETLLLDRAIRLDVPVLGICRGLQFMNVSLGGTLYQDIPTELDTNIMHRQVEGRYEHSHYVTVVGGTPLDKLFGAERVQVNSFHHQAIRELGVGLAVMARADDGIIEAVYGTDSCYMRGYQWHPELLYDTDGFATPLFEDFIKAAGER